MHFWFGLNEEGKYKNSGEKKPEVSQEEKQY